MDEREQNIADLLTIVSALEHIEKLFDQIIANTKAAAEKEKEPGI